MEENYKKGQFCTLPVERIIEDNGKAYFQVRANGREYLIPMFDFQKKDPEVLKRTDLPCMVKDIHGDNIVFVQNFARMFGKDYDERETYMFMVINRGMGRPDGKTMYSVRDLRGVPFKLTVPKGIYLRPGQRVNCKVRLISLDRLLLQYDGGRKSKSTESVTLADILTKSGIGAEERALIERLFRRLPIFAEARELLENGDNEWVIKGVLAVPDFWKWGSMRPAAVHSLVEAYIRISLYLLEESNLIDVDRDNYQELLAHKIEYAETYSEVLEMMEHETLSTEIDRILHKMRNAGFIYHPEHKISILIAIFSVRPELLETRIDDILDVIAATNWSRRNSGFRKAFCLFMTYYIDTKRETVNRLALVNDETSRRLLSRMIRAISYLLLMTDDDQTLDLPLYRSLLYHYLSYVRNNSIGVDMRSIVPRESLVERAFQSLTGADTGSIPLSWNDDITNTEIFAHRMAACPPAPNMPTTKSLESDTVRFSVSGDSISIAPAISGGADHNVVPSGILTWHDIRIYLPMANKFNISHNADIHRWKDWWGRVEHALFAKEPEVVAVTTRKFMPEVGQKVTLRVIGNDPEKPYRFLCRIESDEYYGEGAIDVYGIGATLGLFRFDPEFDISSFYFENRPLLFEAIVNAVVDPDPEHPRFMFNAMPGIDEFVRENCNHGDETDVRVIWYDPVGKVFLSVAREGYGVFISENRTELEFAPGDTVKVRITDSARANRIQAEAIGYADSEVIVREAAENLFYGYCYNSYGDECTFLESDEQMAEDALAISDEQFEPQHILQMIALLDHRALMEKNRVSSYGYLSVARILARMTANEDAVRYLDQRLRMLAILEDFGKNGRVDNQEFERLSDGNEDFIENYPLLQEKLCQIKIVDSIGRQENNPYLWELTNRYNSGHLIGKLARLMLSYNISDGMQLDSSYRAAMIERVKQLLNIRIAVPKIYSFGEEDQLREFKTSVVYPPEQGMRKNIEQQTFNILRVIAGMANAYGGTLYLGVYDTGTAKGLDDDLEHFEGNKDKYKLYVRNRIRLAFGGAFNASIIEEFPDAGDKWIYALRIRPSKSPVALRYFNNEFYFLREGTSTYQYDNAEELQRVMNNRVFSDYDIALTDVYDFNGSFDETVPSTEPAAPERDETVRRPVEVEDETDGIATGRLRPNVVDNWEEGYGIDTCGYLRVYEDGSWMVLDDVPWRDGLLTLALADQERAGVLVAVYPDGAVQCLSLADILRAGKSGGSRLAFTRRPLFLCPAAPEDALLVVYHDSKGRSVMRLDDISCFPISRDATEYMVYPDNNLRDVITCEIISSDHYDVLRPLHNMQANYAYRTDHSYGADIRARLATLGISL